VENCHFHNLKSCLNTIGSSRYGIVQNNHVYNTKFGFKLDGQVSGGTYSTLTGSWIIAGNVFRNIGGADVPISNGGCVAVEEFVEHVKVIGNVMDTLLNVDGVYIRPGQTSKTVIDLEISHNQIANVTNGYGVSLSNNVPGTDPTIRSVRIESNAFNRAERSQVWVLNSNIIREFVVRNNEFVDWSVLGTGSTKQNPAVYLELGAGTWEDFTIEGNLFVRYAPTYFNKLALRVNMAVGVTSERLLVRNNRFKNRASGDLGVRFDGGAVFFEENYVELGEFYVNGCDLDYMRNRTRGQRLIADLSGATPSTVRAEHNDIRRASETTAIEMRGGSSITERDNRYDSTYTDQVLLTSGTRKAADLQTYGGGPRWVVGTGTPEGAVTAPIGSLFTRTDGGASTSLYVKESGTGASGWVAK
jgi:hypothetical protein